MNRPRMAMEHRSVLGCAPCGLGVGGRLVASSTGGCPSGSPSTVTPYHRPSDLGLHSTLHLASSKRARDSESICAALDHTFLRRKLLRWDGTPVHIKPQPSKTVTSYVLMLQKPRLEMLQRRPDSGGLLERSFGNPFPSLIGGPGVHGKLSHIQTFVIINRLLYVHSSPIQM